MLKRHSHIATAAYHDLVRLLRDEAMSDFRGTPSPVTRDGKTYWYDSYRVGSDVRKRYIGFETPELLARLKADGQSKSERDERRAQRTRLVRVLRAEGMSAIDGATGSLMAGLSGAGVFRLGGTLVGTQAFKVYEGLLGLRIGFDQSAMTQDLDIASFEQLSVAVDDVAAPPLAKLLADFDFAPMPSLQPDKTWRWRQKDGGLMVEFLTPSFRPEEDLRLLPTLGVAAQSLHFLNYLIAEPVPAALVYRSGILVQVPRPERYAIHKLIVAARRKGDDASKAAKDRMQAAMLIEILAQDRPDDLAIALQQARTGGAKWEALINKSLKQIPQTKAVLEALPD